jgi:hypothetical protein
MGLNSSLQWENPSDVSTTELSDLSVTTGKLANLAVTADKLGADAVTTTKILDGNVTAAKLANGAGLASLVAAGLGASAVVDNADADPTLLAADDVNARACLVVAVVTETLSTTAAFVVESVGGTALLTIAAGTAGDVLVGAGVVAEHAADSAVRVNATAGDTGAVSVTVLALPTA